MGRSLAGALLTQPPITAPPTITSAIEAVSPDTSLNIKALRADQKDPDADIFEFLAAGATKWRGTFAGALLGGGDIGSLLARINALYGASMDLSGNGRVRGDLTVDGNLNAVLGAVAESLDVTVTNMEASSLTKGEVVRIDTTGPKRVLRAAASSASTATMLGLVAETIVSNASGKVRHTGFATVLLLAGLTDVVENKVVYLSTTAGRATIQDAVPGGAGEVQLPVGRIVDASRYATDNTVIAFIDRGVPRQI